MPLELHKRYEIVFLAKNKYRPHYSINRIAELVNCNRTTVIRWLKQWDETTDLSDRKRIGKSRKTTAEQDEIIINVVGQDVDDGLTSQRLQERIKGDGIVVTPLAIRRRFNEAGFKYLKPLLTAHHKRKRLIWAKSFRNSNWNQMMATDETVFLLHDVKRFYWQHSSEHKVCQTIKYSIKVNAWCCLSSASFGRIICSKKNLTN